MLRREAIEIFFRSALAATTLTNLAEAPVVKATDGWSPKLKPQTPALGLAKTQTLFDVYGLHGSPRSGGEIDLELLTKDLLRLKPKSLVYINPRQELLEATFGMGVAGIYRWHSDEEVLDLGDLKDMALLVKKYDPHPIIQPINEPNLELAETNGQKIIRDYIVPAAIELSRLGCSLLLPPVAPDYNNLERSLTYFKDMIKEVKSHLSLDFMKENRTGVSVHPYVNSINQDPLQLILATDRIVREEIGQPLPIYATEAGHDQIHLKPSAATVKDLVLKHLSLNVPESLRNTLQSYNFWVLDNLIQRPKADRNNPRASRFEDAAWRSLRGERPVFLAVEQIVSS